MHVPVRGQPGPGAGKGLDQIAFVEADDRGDVLSLGCDQGARELVCRKLRLGGHQDQHLVEVGGKGFGADLVLPVEEILAGQHLLDGAFLALTRRGRQPAHTVTHHGLALLAAGVADAPHAIGALDDAVAPVAGHHQALLQGAALTHEGLPARSVSSRASTWVAASKSRSDRPFTSWVLKRTAQLWGRTTNSGW